jgi:tetratricopeptide (TPR) repeat protein
MSNCTLCKSRLLDTGTKTWKLPDGQTVQLEHSSVAIAVATTTLGEFEICESCYRRGLPAFFTAQDLAEIHYQFGLEYRDLKQFSKSMEALSKARGLGETANIVAEIANAERALGNRDKAIDLYRRALELEPDHVMARQNLGRILDTGNAI